ncbi:MAG: transposase [Verrucomicrobiota bacterium]
MRIPRFKASPEAAAGCYHCISRVVDKRFAFWEREREKFRALLREYAIFCGVEVLTWCTLSNHFHLLIKVPQRPRTPPPIEALIDRLGAMPHAGMGVGRWPADRRGGDVGGLLSSWMGPGPG